MTRELVIAGFLVVFGGAVIAVARTIELGVQTDPLGPRAIPLALGAGIALCGLLLGAAALVFRGARGRMGPLSDSTAEQAAPEGPFSATRLIGAVVATALYVAVFERLGYLLATPPYVAAILLIHGNALPRAFLVAPLLITVVLYVTFRFGLLIPVPGGILEAILPW